MKDTKQQRYFSLQNTRRGSRRKTAPVKRLGVTSLVLVLGLLAQPTKSTQCSKIHGQGPWVPSGLGSPLEFDLADFGSSDSGATLEPFSLSFWLKTPAIVSQDQEVLSVRSSDLSSFKMRLILKTDGSLSVDVDDVGLPVPVDFINTLFPSNGFSVVPGSWNYAVFTFEKTGLNHFSKFMVFSTDGERRTEDGQNDFLGGDVRNSDKAVVGGGAQTFEGLVHSLMINKNPRSSFVTNGVFGSEPSLSRALYMFKRTDLAFGLPIGPLSNYYKEEKNFGNLDLTMKNSLSVDTAGTNFVMRDGDYYVSSNVREELDYSDIPDRPLKSFSLYLQAVRILSEAGGGCQNLSGGPPGAKCQILKIQFLRPDESPDGQITLSMDESREVFITKPDNSHISTQKVLSTDQNLKLIANIGFTGSRILLGLAGDSITNGEYLDFFDMADFSITQQPDISTQKVNLKISLGNLNPQTDQVFVPLKLISLDIHKNGMVKTNFSDTACSADASSMSLYSQEPFHLTCWTGLEIRLENLQLEKFLRKTCGNSGPGFFRHFDFETNGEGVYNYYREIEDGEFLENGLDIKKCHPECGISCEGQASNQCLTCPGGKYLDVQLNPSNQNLGGCVDFRCHSTCQSCSPGFFDSPSHCRTCSDPNFEVENGLSEGTCVQVEGQNTGSGGTQGSNDGIDSRKETDLNVGWYIETIKNFEKESTDQVEIKLSFFSDEYRLEESLKKSELLNIIKISHMSTTKEITPAEYEVEDISSLNTITINWKITREFPKGYIVASIPDPNLLKFTSPNTSTIKHISDEDSIKIAKVPAKYPSDASAEVSFLPEETTSKAVKTAATCAISFASLLLFFSGFVSSSAVYLVKLIQFLEFISLFALLRSDFGERINQIFIDIYQAINFDILPNYNLMIFDFRVYRSGYFYNGKISDLKIGVFSLENLGVEIWVLLGFALLSTPIWSTWRGSTGSSEERPKRKIRGEEGQEGKKTPWCGCLFDSYAGLVIMNMKFGLEMILFSDTVFFSFLNISNFGKFLKHEKEAKSFFLGLEKVEIISTVISVVITMKIFSELITYSEIINEGIAIPVRTEKTNSANGNYEKFKRKISDNFTLNINMEKARGSPFCKYFNILYLLKPAVLSIFLITLQNFRFWQVVFSAGFTISFSISTYFYEIKNGFIKAKIEVFSILASELLLTVIMVVLVILASKEEFEVRMTSKEVQIYAGIVMVCLILAILIEVVCAILNLVTCLCDKKSSKVAPQEPHRIDVRANRKTGITKRKTGNKMKKHSRREREQVLPRINSIANRWHRFRERSKNVNRVRDKGKQESFKNLRISSRRVVNVSNRNISRRNLRMKNKAYYGNIKSKRIIDRRRSSNQLVSRVPPLVED